MKILHGLLILTLDLSFTNGIPMKQELLCNSNHLPLWFGNPILIGDILRRIKQTRRCAFVKNFENDSKSETPINPTHIGTKTFEEQSPKDTKLDTKRKKKVCVKIFRSMPRIYYYRMQYGQELSKCHWIDVEENSISTTSAMSITPKPSIPKTNPLEITDFFLRG